METALDSAVPELNALAEEFRVAYILEGISAFGSLSGFLNAAFRMGYQAGSEESRKLAEQILNGIRVSIKEV